MNILSMKNLIETGNDLSKGLSIISSPPVWVANLTSSISTKKKSDSIVVFQEHLKLEVILDQDYYNW